MVDVVVFAVDLGDAGRQRRVVSVDKPVARQLVFAQLQLALRDQRAVGAAKTEVVLDCVLDLQIPGRVGAVVQVALRVLVEDIDGRRRNLLVHRKNGEHRLDAAGAKQILHQADGMNVAGHLHPAALDSGELEVAYLRKAFRKTRRLRQHAQDG